MISSRDNLAPTCCMLDFGPVLPSRSVPWHCKQELSYVSGRSATTAGGLSLAPPVLPPAWLPPLLFAAPPPPHAAANRSDPAQIAINTKRFVDICFPPI